jgi:thiol:disulfide interchange protein DsbC
LSWAPKAKYTVLVFTDVDCPYCRKLHEELSELQANGIAVRYVAFPRSAPETKASKTIAAVWSASDRRSALTQRYAAGKGEGARRQRVVMR